MRPIFTVVVGSAGRDTLPQTIESFLSQKRDPLDRLIVVLDSFEKSRAEVARFYELGRSPAVILHFHDSGYHWYGVEQINWALRNLILNKAISSTHVFTMGDDDVFTQDAFSTLRPLCQQEPLRPILYRFMAPWRRVLWDLPRMKMSYISGCCIAAPTPFVGEMPTRRYVEHDYDWMVEILQRSGVEPLWLDKLLVIARPDLDTGWGAATAPSAVSLSRGV